MLRFLTCDINKDVTDKKKIDESFDSFVIDRKR